MAFFGRKGRPKSGIPTSSMADIAFLLLVFFLVTTVFPKDRGLAIVLPQGPPVEVPAKQVLHITISPSGVIEVRGGREEHARRVRVDQVEGVWRVAVAENRDLIAAVRTHPETQYRHMVDVLDALQTAGAERISLQMQQE